MMALDGLDSMCLFKLSLLEGDGSNTCVRNALLSVSVESELGDVGALGDSAQLGVQLIALTIQAIARFGDIKPRCLNCLIAQPQLVFTISPRSTLEVEFRICALCSSNQISTLTCGRSTLVSTRCTLVRQLELKSLSS
jgi:hypothetical protein